MSREQQIIARDFMGLGHRDDSAWSEAVKQEDSGPSLKLFQDVESRQSGHSKVVGCLGEQLIDTVGNFALRRIANTNLVADPATAENNLYRVGFTAQNYTGIHKSWSQDGASVVVLKEEAGDTGLMLNEKGKGMWHPWNKSVVTYEKFPSWKHVHEEKFTEKTCQSLPGKSAPYCFRSPRSFDDGSLNQANVTIGWCGVNGNFASKCSSPSSGNEVECQLAGHAWQFGFPVTQSGFGPVAANLHGKPVNPQLTIFYAGTVNVFDDIPAEKAQAIMHIAGNNISLSTKAGNFAGSQCISSVPASLPSHLISPSSHLSKYQSQHQHSGIQISHRGASPVTTAVPSQTSYNYGSFSNKPELYVPATPSTPGTLAACSPATFKALPQARKASLTRFLEKRKERVCSKMPYPAMPGATDAMLLPGDKYTAGSVFDVKKHGICRMEAALIEDVATSEMGTEERLWLKDSDTQKHAVETDCSSVGLVCQ